MVIFNNLSKVPQFPGAKHVFLRKSKMAARGHTKIVTYEEFNIYSFVIPIFQLSFHEGLISGLRLEPHSCFVCKIKNSRLIQY